MDVLAWLAFPIVATALAMCWAAWRGRDRAARRDDIGGFGVVDSLTRHPRRGS